MTQLAPRGHPTEIDVLFEALDGGDDIDCCAAEARVIAVLECTVHENCAFHHGPRFTCPRCRKEWRRVVDEDGRRGWEEVLP